MSAPASHPLDLDALPPDVREAFLVLQAEVTGLRAQTERQDYLIAELRHALYGKKSEQLDPDARQLAFEDLETAAAEAEIAADASVARNADGTTRRPAAKRNLGHLPDHPLPGNRMLAFDERGPRIEEVIEPEHKVCPCGCTDRVKIGEGEPLKAPFIARQVFAGKHREGVRAQWRTPSGWTSFRPVSRSSAARQRMFTCARGVTIRPKYACRRCDAGISQAATPHWLIEGGLPTEGTLAPLGPLLRNALPGNACRSVQVCRSLAALSSVPDIWAGWRQPRPVNAGDLVWHHGLPSGPSR